MYAVRPVSILAALLITITGLGCRPATGPSQPPESAASTGEAATAEGEDQGEQPGEGELVSVRPGINDRYFEDGAIETWTDILERERREVIAHRDEIVAALALEPGTRVADIGAGTGAFVAALSAGVGPAGKVYAVDIVPSFLDHLRARATSDELANLEVIEATPTDASLPAASVDLLFMCDVYHHIEYPAIYLDSLDQALADDGRFVVVEFDRVPGVTSARMLKHVRQDKATLIAEMKAAGFVLEREIESIPFDENYMLVFVKA